MYAVAARSSPLGRIYGSGALLPPLYPLCEELHAVAAMDVFDNIDNRFQIAEGVVVEILRV
jgi:hypothetical protein